VLKKLFDALSSYWLACLILLGLMWLTIVGTLSQKDIGLYQSQVRYFDSLLVLHHVAGPWHVLGRDISLQVPFPGGQTLLILLAINLLCGGFVRFRYRWSRIGITITHVGIVMMLFAGLVKFRWGHEGSLLLYEGQQSDEYVSDRHWEIAILEPLGAGKWKEHSIPDAHFLGLTGEGGATFTSDALPFELSISRVMPNCDPVAAGPFARPEVPVVDGVFLRERALHAQQEANVVGAYASVQHKAGRGREEAVLWGDARAPWVVEDGGKRYGIDLRRKRHRMPYVVRLDDFVRELHPRTDMAASFESFVTKIENGSEQKVHIEMNKPMRDQGLILFQTNWGPQDRPPADGRYYSVLTVVDNPSDQGPLVSLIVITLGLLVHFGLKLIGYLDAEARAREALV
jgi:hypothetical protein